MYYIKIATEDNRILYQEVQRGTVQRITDLDGNTVSTVTGSSWVIESEPVQPSWALPDNPEPVIIYPKTITRLAFRNLFTMSEKLAIYQAAETNLQIKIWLDDLSNAEYVDLNDIRIQQDLQGLVALGLLTELRKEEILYA